MSTVDIYRGTKKIDSKNFRSHFMIVTEENEYGFRWEADEETASRRGGGILVWIRALRPPNIHFIPPGWELVVDGVMIVEKDSKDSKRDDIQVQGEVAEMRHDDFRFVCHF
jgi:hypothetical protein